VNERMPWRPVTLGAPDGEWWPLTDITALPAGDWYADLLAGAAKGRRDVAAAYLASYFTEVIVGPTASAVLHDGAVWPVQPDTFHVHRHVEGWYDGTAVVADRLWMDDDHPGSDGLLGAVAEGIVAIARPWFDAVRRLGPYGRFGMWGSLADGIGSAATQPYRTDAAAARTAFARAQLLLDAIAAREPALRVRPPLRTVTWSGGEACASAQGTCCLYYKVHDPADGEHAYCTGCPLPPPELGATRYVAWLETEFGGAAAG
jgi:hypothetical protein